MIIEFLTKNYNAGEKLKDVISKKLDRLDKFFEDDTKVRVMLKQAKDVYTLELTIMIDHIVLRAEVFSENMYDNIDVALPKLEKQIVKHHKRIISKSKKVREKALVETAVAAEKDAAVVRSKKYVLTPMSVDEAMEEQELVGHSFYVFLNKETQEINVLYKRNDGDYGLIHTEIEK